MRKLLGFVAVGFLILGIVVHGRTHANPPYAAPVQSYTPVTGGAVVVPYNAAVVGGVDPGLSKADGRRIIELLESIDKKLSNAPVAQGLPGVDVLKVAQKACISCHTPGRADDKGSGYVLFADDKGTAFKPVNRARRAEENKMVRDEVITRRTMPKGGKLTEAERSAFEQPIYK